MPIAFASLIVLAALQVTTAQNDNTTTSFPLPPQSVLVDPRSFAVLGQNATFRNSSFDSGFNPTSTTPPFFQIIDQDFLKILGRNPSIVEIASNPDFAFAHEAPIFMSETDELFFASTEGDMPVTPDNINHNNRISKISMAEVEAALKASKGATVNVTVTPLDLPDTIQETNGGTGPFRSSLLLTNNGRGQLPPTLALVNPKPPHNVTVLVDNFFGRQFNSLNDVKIHPSGKIFFTDTIYGFLLELRPEPLFPSQVYRFDPDTGVVRVVADGFDKCNGIAFTPDGKTAYIGDTGALMGFLGNNQTRPTTVYAFDVDPISHAFKNRRVLAYVDAGIPDGIQLDTNGNIYSSTGDGAQVWNPQGTLLGKFFLGTRSANMIFAGKGRFVILAETKIFLARIDAEGINLTGK